MQLPYGLTGMISRQRPGEMKFGGRNRLK